MRLHFQEKPWDLGVALTYVIVVAGGVLAAGVGNLLGILLVLFIPGYVLMAALFPGPEEIDWIERTAISIGLSLAVIPLLGLALNFTPLGIRFTPIVVTITLFSVAVGYVAYRRRMRLPPERRLSATLDLTLPAWKQYSAHEKLLTVALGVSIVVASGTLMYVALTPRPAERFTEFYILGPSGNASGYPTSLNVSQPGSVILGVANHESANLNYITRIDLVGVRIVYNATSGANETIEVNRTTWSTFNVALANGRNWTQPYTFRINYTGLWKVQFLLFKDGDFSSAYRELHLYVRVT